LLATAGQSGHNRGNREQQGATMSTLPQLTDALLTLENRVATLTMNRHDLRNAFYPKGLC